MRLKAAILALGATLMCLTMAAEAATLIARPAHALMHEGIRLKLRGLRASQAVLVRAELTDDAGVTWRSEARFTADRRGRVDLDRARALSGTYVGVDPNGLFWSMLPAQGAGTTFIALAATNPRHSLTPVLDRGRPHSITVTAWFDGTEVARTVVTRSWIDARVRSTEIEEGALRGVLYEPARGSARRAVVLLTGSGGGVDRDWAPLLAARGYAVFALGYFQYKDRPRFPADLPLEYFADSLRWMQSRLGHRRIGLIGISRGSEAALLTAANFPDLARAVVVVAPGHLSTAGFHPERGLNVATWSQGGRPLPYSPFPEFSVEQIRARHGTPDNPLRQAQWYAEMYAREGEADRFGIPVERMRTPLLLLSGSDDTIWPSQLSGSLIAERLAQHRYPYEVRHQVIEGAGHTIWMSPNAVTSYAHLDHHRLVQAFTTSGGSPAANAKGAADAFRYADSFLRRHLR